MAAASWRRIKKLRSYTYEQAARKLDVSERTVQEWVRKHGLRAFTEQRPHIIIGEDMIAFLRRRANDRKVPLSLSQFYCLRCRAARKPAFGIVQCDTSRPGAAAVTAFCGVCEAGVNKRIPRDRLPEFWRLVDALKSQA